MVVSLIGSIDNDLVQRVLMVAAFAGVTLKVIPINEGVENTTVAFRHNCHPLEKLPVMKTDEGYIFGAHAMIRYLSRIEVPLNLIVDETDKYPHPQYPVPYTLYGHSLLESAQVDAWLEFVARRMDVHIRPRYAHMLQKLKTNTEHIKSLTKTHTPLHQDNSSNSNNNNNYSVCNKREEIPLPQLSELWDTMTYLEEYLMALKEIRKQLIKDAGGVLTVRTLSIAAEQEIERVRRDIRKSNKRKSLRTNGRKSANSRISTTLDNPRNSKSNNDDEGQSNNREGNTVQQKEQWEQEECNSEQNNNNTPEGENETKYTLEKEEEKRKALNEPKEERYDKIVEDDDGEEDEDDDDDDTGTDDDTDNDSDSDSGYYEDHNLYQRGTHGGQSKLQEEQSRLSVVYNVAGTIRDRMERLSRHHMASEPNAISQETLHNKSELKHVENVNKENCTKCSTVGIPRMSLKTGSVRGSGMTPRASNVFGPHVITSATPHALPSSAVNNNNTAAARETILTARSRSSSSARVSSVLGHGHQVVPLIIQRHDLLFLVGDSLTAADISLMTSLHLLLSIDELKPNVIENFSNCVKYYRALMLLPLITQLRRALRITIINS